MAEKKTARRETSTARKAARKKPAKKASNGARATVLNVNHPGSEKSISREKYELISAAVLAVLPKKGDGVTLNDLPSMVEQRLSTKERRSIGSSGQIAWHVMAVKLDLEARKRIERVAGSRPQRLRRIG